MLGNRDMDRRDPGEGRDADVKADAAHDAKAEFKRMSVSFHGPA